MKDNLLRILIIIPVVLFAIFVVLNQRSATKQSVLGSSIIFTVGDSGITCSTKAYTTNPATGQIVEIDGTNLKGAPLESEVTYKTTCINSGNTVLTNITLTNGLSGQNQNYLTYKNTTENDCGFNGSNFVCNTSSLAVRANFERSYYH